MTTTSMDVHFLPKPPSWTAPFYCAFTVALLSGAIAACDRLRLNRLFGFGVGVASLARRCRERKHLSADAPPQDTAEPIGAPLHEQAARSAVAEPGP
jgi:hypothetical protein